MPTNYCSQGHRVNYSGAKPKACPSCGTDMEPKSVASLAADSTPPAAAPARQPWPKVGPLDNDETPRGQSSRFEVQQTLSSDDDMQFDSASVHVAGVALRPTTLRQLAESGVPVERRPERSSADGGGDSVSVAKMVTDMVAAEGAQRGQQVAQASTTTKRAKPQRAPRRNKQGGAA